MCGGRRLDIGDDTAIVGRNLDAMAVGDAPSAEVNVTMTNISNAPIVMYNPTLNPFLLARQRAVEIILKRADGSQVADLLSGRGGSSLAGPRKDDWVNVGPNRSVSTLVTLGLKGGNVISRNGNEQLAPGKYTLQAIAHAPLLSGPPAAFRETSDPEKAMQHPSYKDWCESFPGPVICQSNIVEISIGEARP